MPPKRLLIMTSYHNDWLYAAMMGHLRERYGTTFYIVASHDRMTEFQALCADKDTVVSIDYPGLEFRSAVPDEDAVYARARENEKKYGIRYMMDLIQQDPTCSSSFMGYTQNQIYGPMPGSLASIYDLINRAFRYFEQLFDSEGFDGLINRPKALLDAVMVTVATSRRVPTTFFHSSYFGGDAIWANGPYMGADFYREVYERTPVSGTDEEYPRAPNEVWKRPPAPSRAQLIKNLMRTALIYASFAYRDFRSGSKSQRVPFRSTFIGLIHQFRVQRYVDTTTNGNLDELTKRPFVYFALPFEPEYTVQSLCRKFADTNAVIRQLALSLPAGYNLILKEHQRIGNRSIAYYENWRKYPNIILAHPAVRGVDLIRRAEFTATMGGSTPMEAALIGTPSIVFGTQNPYGILPSVFLCDNLRELPATIDRALASRTPELRQAYKRAAARFKTAYSSVAFDATGTILNRSGTKTKIPDSEVRQAVDAFVKVLSAQRDRLAMHGAMT